MMPIAIPVRRAVSVGSRSLGARLLVWWCALLALLLSGFLWAGYRDVQGVVVSSGGDRAHVAAEQLARLVSRSVQTRRNQMTRVADDAAVRRFLGQPTPAHLDAARARLAALATPAAYRIALWTHDGAQLLEIAGSDPTTAASEVVFPAAAMPTAAGVKPLRTDGDLTFSETVIPVAAESDAGTGVPPSGFLVVRVVVSNGQRWLLTSVSRTTLALSSADIVARLVGSEATMGMGNTTGDGWTDLTRSVPAPLVDLDHDHVGEYQTSDGEKHIGSLVLVAGTPWAVWVEFPSRALLAPVRALLRRGISLALGFLIVGVFLITAVTTRTLKPLRELAQAARDIAAGNFRRRVGPQRQDEIGELAASFNLMAGSIEAGYGALRHANDETQFALSAARMGVWEVNPASAEVTWSPAMAAVFGLTPAMAPRTLETVMTCVHPDDRTLVADALAAPRDYAVQFRIIWPDKSLHWVESRAQVVAAAPDGAARLLAVSTDITERKHLEDALFSERERARVTLHSIADAVISTDVDQRITFINTAAQHLTGWGGPEAIGRSRRDVFEVVEIVNQPVPAPSGSTDPCDDPDHSGCGNGRLVRRDGSSSHVDCSVAPIHDRDGSVIGAVFVFRDVGPERALALKMAHLAQYDALTNLPNRTLLGDRITQATASARRRGTRLAILFVDVDRFKQINDSLGHTVGDALLRSVTARLITCVRESDTVSRRGGDEFVVLLAEIDQRRDAGMVAERILGALAAPHDIAGHVLNVSASIGLSVYPEDALGAEALISAADTAMYQAKDKGRSNYQFFTSQMNVRAVARRSLEASLRQALLQRQFVLHYQPKFNLKAPAITGVEALIRWQHPVRGLLSPLDFVGVAEESGLILPIGRWVVREACRQAQAWQDAGLGPRAVAVNVSAIEFRARDFLDDIAAALGETGLSPEYLEIEVTESVLMASVDGTVTTLSALKALGVRVAIDDFGTGYSNLSCLSRFPIDTLKIDRSFVAGLAQSGDDTTLITAIIAMGRSMKQCIVAEGIETEAQLAALRTHACDEGQGYYFSRPGTADQIEAQLRRDPAGYRSITASGDSRLVTSDHRRRFVERRQGVIG